MGDLFWTKGVEEKRKRAPRVAIIGITQSKVEELLTVSTSNNARERIACWPLYK